MARLHLKYRNIRPGVVKAVQDLIHAKPHTVEISAEKLALAQNAANLICAEYGVKAPNIEITPTIRRASAYRPSQRDALGGESTAQIVLRKFSVFTLLSSLAQHINSKRTFQFERRAFAASAFYLANPVTFRKAVRDGRIKGVDAVDTFTAESWEKLSTEGFTRGRKLTSSATAEIIKSVLDGSYRDEHYEAEAEETVPVVPEVSETPAAAVTDDDLESLFGGNDDEGTVEAPVELENIPLDKMNRDQLRAEAARLNIAGRGRMLADDLRTAIAEALTV